MLKDDPLTNVLYINLTKKSFRIEKRPDLFEDRIGGTGAAIRLLVEECPRGSDPLGPDNPIVFAVGPLTAMFPLGSKTVAMFKSPHTGNLGESHCGGRSAAAIRLAGYGAIVITGASETPIYLAIHGNRVYFRDASSLWGMGNSFTVGRIIRENEPGAGVRTIMRIGGAGENRVSYACVTAETYRHFGRLGLGAVFGSKKLKAVVVSGKRSLPTADRKAYQKLYDEIYQTAVTSSVMKKYHDLGTAGNVLPLNELGSLPTKNLLSPRFATADRISGESLAKNYLGRRLACAHCPVSCIHIAALREPYEEDAFFYKTSMISYDYEPIYSLGSLLGIDDPEGMLKLMEQAEIWGLDAMSTGVIFAWATEAMEKGLITEKDTAGLRFAWGDYRAYSRAVRMIVEPPNPFYRALARGLDHASSIYGGAEFALTFGGNEMAGYHTGPGTHLGAMIGARHSHLDNAGYSADQKALTTTSKTEPEALVRSLIEEEQWRQILSSLVVCFFARGIYTPEVVSRALQVCGQDVPAGDLLQIGKEILREKMRFKLREGFSFDRLRFPKRIFEAPTPLGDIDQGYLQRGMEEAKRQ
ncbi:MAG: aldehyde ferredoxin oxidoreductase family protein [Thermodesulfobacteriota bacterium]